MKKANLFIYTLIITILSIVSVNAKMMNVEEIGKEVEKYSQNARYVYVIGKYVYTSTYNNFNLQDVMLAASDSITINSGTDVKSQVNTMTIYRIDRTYDGYTPNGWKLGANEIGNGSELSNSEKVDIRYIDYNLLENESTAKVSVDLDVEGHSEYKKVLKDALGFEAKDNYGRTGNKLTVENGKVKGLLLRNKEKITLSPEDKQKYNGKDYYLAYIIEVPNATDKTKVTVKSPNKTDGEEVDHNSFDVKIEEKNENKTPGVVMLVPLSPESAKTGKIEVTIDLDGDNNAEYGPTTYTLDLSELEFQEDSKIEEIGLGKDKASSTDKETLRSWGYNSESNKDLSLTKDGENDFNYKLTGQLVEQNLHNDVYGKEKSDAYYFDFTLVLGNNKDKKAVVKATVNGNSDSKTFLTSDYDEQGNLTILQRIGKDTVCNKEDVQNKTNCIIKLEIDLDGNEDKYLPQTYTLDYSALTFEKTSLFTVSALDQEDTKQFPENDHSWYDTESGYNVEVQVDPENPTKYNVSGVLPIFEDEDVWKDGPFDTDEKLYYLGLQLKLTNPPADFGTGKDVNENTINIKFYHGDEEDSQYLKAHGSDFDTSKELYILKALTEEAADGTVIADSEKYFTITVDLDGETEDEYAPYTVTIDWSKLKLQKPSSSTISKDNVHENTKKELTEWGYSEDSNKNLTFTLEPNSNTVKLTGTLVEQELTGAPFGENNKEGYYFTFTFVVPNGTESGKVLVERLKNKDGSEVSKTFKQEEFDENGNLTILYKFNPETKKCETSNNENCKLYYRIDLDGNGKAYLPTTYTIDYSELVFEKSSLVKIEAIDSSDITKENEQWKNFTEGEKYSTKFDETGATFKVTGLITIFDDDKWKDNTNPFGHDAYDYYLAFKLSKIEGVSGKEDSTTIVKFLTEGSGHGDKNKIDSSDFGENNSIYVLKYINPNTDYENRKFEITIDYDGEDEEYVPYTITIDWSELDFQYESTHTTTEVVNSTASKGESGYISEEDKQQITSWGYKFEDSGENLKIENNGVTIPWKITGKIKEQKVKAGYKTEDGYYLVINVYGPDKSQAEHNHFLSEEDGLRKWTFTLKNEEGEYKTEYTPTKEEYDAGYATVLLKIKEDARDKKITIKIDWDGSNSDVFLPYEETIDYSELGFISLNTLTYNYKNNQGESIREIKEVYEGVNITPKEMTTENTDTRTFTKWVDDKGNEKSDEFTTSHDENVVLTAHWSLDTDQFFKDIIDDLNDADSEISEDYTNKFVTSMNGNTITFDVKDAEMLLSAMDETTIPKAIAYILNKEEIKDITLTTAIKDKANQSVKFTKNGANNGVQAVSLTPELESIVSSVKTGANTLFKTVLDEELENMTLNKMAITNSGYTLTIGEVDETVELKNTEQKTYTFNFTSDVALVKNEKELKEALDNKQKNIEVASSFTISEKQNVNRQVNIYGKDENITLTGGENLESIFEVSSTNVNISNLKLTNAKKAIKVTGTGALTFTSLDLAGNKEAGIEVDNGGTISGDKLTMTDESYDKPAVKASKTGATTIRLTDSEQKDAQKIIKQKIIKSDGETSNTDSKQDDTEYGYYNYYNNALNSKIYTIKFFNYEGGYRQEFTRYSTYNSKIDLPPTNLEQGKFSIVDDFSYDGHKYNLMGYSLYSSRSVAPKDATSECEVPSDVSKDLTTKGDAHYFTAYCVKLPEGTVKVSNTQQFKDELAKSSVNAIYIEPGVTIDYQNEELTIDRKVSIVGRSDTAKIIAKKINITADEVFMQRLNLELNAESNQEALINVTTSSDKAKLSLWQVKVKNTGENAKSAVKVSNPKEVVIDVRWSTFSAEYLNNYIYADGPLGEGTNIYLNTFNELTNPESGKYSDIIIKSFAKDAVIEDDETDVIIKSNTYKGDNYAIKILKDASSNRADIDVDITENITIAVEYNDTQNQFESIHILSRRPQTLKDVYLKENSTTEETTPGSGTRIKFTIEAEIPQL